VRSRATFHGGVLDLVARTYWPGGALKFEWTYNRGLLDGPYRNFREDGSELLLGEYENGKQAGLWMLFRADGSSDPRSGYYEDGVRVRDWKEE